MPIYEYRCEKGHKHEEIRPFTEYRLPAICPKCKAVSERIPSSFTPITDTNFWYTGKYDKRLGHIEGRKDFWAKCKKKGYSEIPSKDFAVTTTLADRMKNIPAPME